MLTLDELHCRYDGPIPRHLLTAAQQRAGLTPDRASSRGVAGGGAQRNAAARIGRVTIKPAIAIPAMAEDLLQITGEQGCCTEADLRARGWSADDIARHGDAAAARARALTQTGLDRPHPGMAGDI